MTSTSFSYFATSKRTACDRCHAMKLRCPERDDLTQPCNRCSRARAECTVSYNRPLGRRARLEIPATVPQINQQSAQTRSTAVVWPGDTHDASHRNSPSSAASTLLPATPSSLWPPGGESQSLPDDLSGLFECQDDSNGSMAPNLGADTDALARSQQGNSWTVDSLDLYVPTESSVEFEGSPQLALLNYDLSQQLEAWRKTFQSSGSNCSPNENESSFESLGSEKSNPFSDALQAMSKLVAITQGYKKRPANVIILHFITAYLQITALCNHMFVRLHHLLRDALEPQGQSLQVLPGIHLAGILVQQGDLQAKALVHAILHNFQSLEKALSLPPELCLYWPQEAPKGLLCSEQDQFVIKMLVRDGPSGAEGSHYIESLRNNVTQVRQRLAI